MSKQLAMNTTVEGETYAAGTVPPAEVAKKITNPKAWGEEPKPDAAPEPEPENPEAPKAPPAPAAAPASPAPSGPPPSAPPANGK